MQRDLLNRDVVKWPGMVLIRHAWLNVVVEKTNITLLLTVEATFGVIMVENLTIGAQLVLCSTKKVEAASIFTTLVNHAEQNHGRLHSGTMVFFIYCIICVHFLANAAWVMWTSNGCPVLTGHAVWYGANHIAIMNQEMSAVGQDMLCNMSWRWCPS